MTAATDVVFGVLVSDDDDSHHEGEDVARSSITSDNYVTDPYTKEVPNNLKRSRWTKPLSLDGSDPDHRAILRAAASSMTYQSRKTLNDSGRDDDQTSSSTSSSSCLHYPLRLKPHRMAGKGQVAPTHPGWPLLDREKPEKLDYTRMNLSSPSATKSLIEDDEDDLELTNSIVSEDLRLELDRDDENDSDGPDNETGFSIPGLGPSLKDIVHESIQIHPLSTHQQTRIDDRENMDCSPILGLKGNDVKLHIYDLIAKDALMRTPWGCVFEIGKCFNDVNAALHELGTGAYHVGVEVNGIEYAYGATSIPGKSGVFTSHPRLSPGYQYRTTIDFGIRPLLRKNWIQVCRTSSTGEKSTVFRQSIEHIDGRKVIKSMVPEYMGIDYDILRRNCCTFARDVCLRLGIQGHEIPTWFRNLAESGAFTRDLALATVSPIANVFSEDLEDKENAIMDDMDDEQGFEIVSNQGDIQGIKGGVVVITVPSSQPTRTLGRPPRNTAWIH